MTLALAGGGWTATLLPARGGALARLALGGSDVLLPLPDDADPNATWAGAFLMLPWTNRLDEGRLPHPGGVHHYPLNRAEERTALHGLSREAPWEVAEAAPHRAVLTQRHAAPGQPYRYAARLEVTLGEAFALRLDVTNEGEDGTPFGTGWHPFFVRPAGVRVAFRATGAVARDARNLPIAVEASGGVAGGEAAMAGKDTHYVGWDGTADLDLGSGQDAARLRMRADDAWSRNLQLFAPPGADVLCVEPVSHVPDVVNRRAFAPHGDMVALPRGGVLSGAVTLSRR